MHHSYEPWPGTPTWPAHQSLGHQTGPSPTQESLSRWAADRYAQLERLERGRVRPRRVPRQLARLPRRLWLPGRTRLSPSKGNAP